MVIYVGMYCLLDYHPQCNTVWLAEDLFLLSKSVAQGALNPISAKILHPQCNTVRLAEDLFLLSKSVAQGALNPISAKILC